MTIEEAVQDIWNEHHDSPHRFDYCYHSVKSGGTCRYRSERWWITPIGNIFGRCWNHMLTRGESRDLKELSKKEVAVYRVMES